MSGPSPQSACEDTLGIGSLTLHYAAWRQAAGTGRAVLLIHGLTASGEEFALLGTALAEQGWWVITPDLRGRGLSGNPPHGSGVALHAHDLLTLCDHLGIASPAVVGHSLGAMIGMYLAAVYPPRMRRLVMIDAGGHIPDYMAQAIAASANRLGTVFPSLEAYQRLMRLLPMIQWNAVWPRRCANLVMGVARGRALVCQREVPIDAANDKQMIRC